MDFVSGWTIMQTLGEGAFGEVKLVVNKDEGSAVAMKIVNLREHPEAEENVVKEINILRLLNNPHIIKYFGQRKDDGIYYIFLEYASGGELFDKIEPDIGMESLEAQKYFKELISGVEYLHSQGIAHRDIKPENLLLDEHDLLKITDFGMATCFRLRGKTRMLDKKCGTVQYIAPEVILRPYKAEPVDIWACGIVLVAMLSGELPWEAATLQCKEYLLWKNNTSWMEYRPWCKFDNLALSLVRKVLHPLPSQRYTIDKIKGHRWWTKNFGQGRSGIHNGEVTPPHGGRLKRMRSNDISPPSHEDLHMSHSQPVTLINGSGGTSPGAKAHSPLSFSQPAQIDDLLVSSQYLATQSNTSQDTMSKLVRRMTRFFVSLDPEESLLHLHQALDSMGLSWRTHTAGIVTITTVDKHKNQLVFKAYVHLMDKRTLLDFRLSKGCGLEFKRRFLALKKKLMDIVVKGPVSWSIAIATNNVP